MKGFCFLLSSLFFIAFNTSFAHSPDDDIRTTVIDEGMITADSPKPAAKKQLHSKRNHQQPVEEAQPAS